MDVQPLGALIRAFAELFNKLGALIFQIGLATVEYVVRYYTKQSMIRSWMSVSREA
jgi:hypothetical protein